MNNIKNILENQKNYFNKGITRNINFRIKMLKALKDAIINHEEDIIEALNKDLKKSKFESYITEIGILIDEINFAIKNVKSWAKPKRVKTPLMHFKSRSYIYKEPYGVALIIAPWNYPFQLVLSPLIGAIASGNCSILKPSEYTPNTSNVISKIFNKAFSRDYIAVIEGDSEVSKALLKEKFDYIFFTGSVPVGKKVMAAASENLVPITLELGGKSPCIVTRDGDIKLWAKRIVWGKYLNAGQTCVAPDYLVVHKSIKEQLIIEMKKSITDFYGEDPSNSKDYVRIINEKHFERLIGLLDKGKILYGGKYNREELYISPTLIDNITWNDPVMEDEIFGPILPILSYENLEDVISMINNHPKPLALYIFSNNKIEIDKIVNSIQYGGGCINDTILHLATPYLPFGGIGSSGMGSYHGKASFNVFTHEKSILNKSNIIDIPFRYPPYNDKNLKLVKKFFK